MWLCVLCGVCACGWCVWSGDTRQPLGSRAGGKGVGSWGLWEAGLELAASLAGRADGLRRAHGAGSVCIHYLWMEEGGLGGPWEPSEAAVGPPSCWPFRLGPERAFLSVRRLASGQHEGQNLAVEKRRKEPKPSPLCRELPAEKRTFLTWAQHTDRGASARPPELSCPMPTCC